MRFGPDIAVGKIRVAGEHLTFYDSSPGAATRRPVVLLHGTGGSAAASFWALLPMLAIRHRVIAVDFLDAHPAGSEPSLEAYVEQARSVIAACCPDGRAHVVGYSFGAVVATVLAADDPECVDDLTLVAGWAKTDAQQRLRNDLWRDLHESDPLAAGRLTVFTSHSADFLADAGDDGIERLVHQCADGPDRTAKMLINRGIDIEHKLEHVRARTLIVACKQDAMVPARHAEQLFGALVDARLAWVDTGHAALQERPAEVCALIERFLAALDGDTPGSVLEVQHV